MELYEVSVHQFLGGRNKAGIRSDRWRGSTTAILSPPLAEENDGNSWRWAMVSRSI